MRRVVCLVVMCCSLLFLSSCGEGPIMATIGSPAPDFTLVDLNGKSWTMSQLKGQVVLINFWATWCPPCREEMPSMERLYQMMPKDKFKMLAILNRDDPKQGELFVKKLGFSAPVLDDQINAVGPKFGLTGLPETFIIDKEGIVRERYIGPAQWDAPDVLDKINKLLDK